jgi:hypothetical protein
MGISRHYGDVLSVPNLFKNGGLDFQDPEGATPPFYSVGGAIRKAIAPGAVNTWEQVFGEVPDVAGAPFNYLKFILPKSDPVTVGQDLTLAFGAVLDHAVPVDAGEMSTYGYYATEGNLVYQGPITVSFSLRVVQGAVSVGFTRNYNVSDPADEYEELDPSFSSSTWRRFTGTFEAANVRLGIVAAQFQRKGRSQAVEVHIGNMMLATGAYNDLPYTGDPAAAVFPRGAIVMCMGTVAPPGFAPVSQDDVFPREGVPGESGGALHHTHEMNQKMYPPSGWPRRSLLGSDEARVVVGMDEDAGSKADPARDHTHELSGDQGSNNTEPIYRAFLFCKRV